MNTNTGGHGNRKTGTGRALAVLFLLSAVGMFLSGCGEKVTPGAAQVKRQTISGVSVAALAPTTVEEFTEATGTVKAASTSYVASRMMGAVTSLLVKEGDAVEKGQLLLTIDDRDVVQKVRAAEAGYQEAIRALGSAKQNRELTEITYQRYRTMYAEKAISRQEMDQFETQKTVAALEYERVREMVDRASAGLSEAKIYLGFTGDHGMQGQSESFRNGTQWRDTVLRHTRDILPAQLWEREIVVDTTPLWLLIRFLPCARLSPPPAERKILKLGSS